MGRDFHEVMLYGYPPKFPTFRKGLGLRSKEDRIPIFQNWCSLSIDVQGITTMSTMVATWQPPLDHRSPYPLARITDTLAQDYFRRIFEIKRNEIVGQAYNIFITSSSGMPKPRASDKINATFPFVSLAYSSRVNRRSSFHTPMKLLARSHYTL